MTLRKMLSMFAVVMGALALFAPTAVAQPQVGDLSLKSWRDGPFTAKDTRLLIYNVSRAGHDHEHMNLDRDVISRAGITIKGRKCDSGDTWLNFSEQAKTHFVGGQHCDGTKAFERKPGYKAKRYETLMTYISDQMFIGVGIHGQDVGAPKLIRSNGRRALYLFERNSGNRPVHSIKAVRLTGKKASIKRY